MSDAFDGVLVVDKPEGPSSHDVVAAVRRRLPRSTGVGHTGTLDPFATGVLALVVGRATRLARFLVASRKHYVADVAFGSATDSGDRTGTVVETASDDARSGLDAERLARALASCVGTHPQVPPAISAKKVDGTRAYELARKGEAVELAPVEVTAYAVNLEHWDAATGVARVSLETSPGYYVRAFARDLGAQLGVPAHLRALRRVASGEFTLETAKGLGEIVSASREELQAFLCPLGTLLPDWPAVVLDDPQMRLVTHGQAFATTSAQQAAVRAGGGLDGRVRLLDATGDLVGLARPVGDGRWHADVVLGRG